MFILFYFRGYPVPMAQGFFLGMGQPPANAWIHRLRPVRRAALGYDLQLPARHPRDIAAVLETCPGLEFSIDGTERPIRRPTDGERQKADFSGQKKRPTSKPARSRASARPSRANGRIRNSPTHKTGRSHPAADCGKTPAFRATNRKT